MQLWHGEYWFCQRNKGCFGRDIFYGLKYDGTLCHYIISRRGISRSNSKYDINFIKSLQLSRVSRYGTGKKAEYFDYNNE